MCGAPKGIRNLTCAFRYGSAVATEFRIVAGQGACAVSIGWVASQPDSGCFSAFPARKARERHRPLDRSVPAEAPTGGWTGLGRGQSL